MVKNMTMSKANVHEVKAKLSEYLDRAVRGEHIIICRHNKPVAELRALEQVRTKPRPIGPLPGRPTFDVPVSFFEPMADDDLAAWEGGDPSDPLSQRSNAWAPRAKPLARTVAGHNKVAEQAKQKGTFNARRKRGARPHKA
jgi:antitoxin (DNA-binding transcriptional repressor) of toxin-antitoxin stability system